MQFDLVVLVTIAVILFLYSTWRGRGSLASLILSLYPAALLFQEFPFTKSLIFMKATSFKVSLSYLIIFLAFVALTRYILYRTLTSHANYGGGVVVGVLVAVISTGTLIALEYHLPGLKNLHPFTPTISQFFVSQTAYFWWLVGPAAIMILF